jgi:hypothetical protein
MSNIDYIITLCQQITAQNKTPSVAVIRNMAKQPLSIPEVIKALQNWKANPHKRPQKSTPQSAEHLNVTQPLEQRVMLLEQQLATVIKTLASLSAK